MAFHPQSSSYQQHAAFANYGSSSSSNFGQRQANAQFDIVEWYPQFQSCHRYFIDHAQHSSPVQAVAAFINIQLPYQKMQFPVMSSTTSSPRSSGPHDTHLRPNPFSTSSGNAGHPSAASLIPYIRRLIVTGHDTAPILHGFFGDDWVKGIGSLHEIERRNYLFAAKSTSWLKVKQAYDMSPDETCPFLSPLRDATEEEIQAAEATWSDWLAMQDWMLGPRSPDSPRVKREPRE